MDEVILAYEKIVRRTISERISSRVLKELTSARRSWIRNSCRTGGGIWISRSLMGIMGKSDCCTNAA